MSAIGEQIIASVRAAAAVDPNFIYDTSVNGCKYVRHGQPSCLIGHGLWGLIDHALERTDSNRVGIDTLLRQLDIELDPEEREWLDVAQGAQDSHAPWGQAVEIADDVTSANTTLDCLLGTA